MSRAWDSKCEDVDTYIRTYAHTFGTIMLHDIYSKCRVGSDLYHKNDIILSRDIMEVVTGDYLYLQLVLPTRS